MTEAPDSRARPGRDPPTRMCRAVLDLLHPSEAPADPDAYELAVASALAHEAECSYCQAHRDDSGGA
jgi:hypothetical protein